MTANLTAQPPSETVTVTGPRELFAGRAVQTLADALTGGLMACPHEIMLHRHGATARQLLEIADQHSRPVNVSQTCAFVVLIIATEDSHAVNITYTLYSNDLSETAQRAYHEHNEVCLITGPGE